MDPHSSHHPPCVRADSTLLVTGSADKNIKIWGLDFGDCHRSLFAHADSVMAVAFVPNTHYLFTAGAWEGAVCWPWQQRQMDGREQCAGM